jgi:hypothetical protein
MKIDPFSLIVPEGKEHSDGYVELPHGAIYTLMLVNESVRRCDVAVKIDGGVIGKFRVNAQSRIKLERPVHDTGRFIFYSINSTEAKKAGLESSYHSGVVSATFMPEAVDERRYSRAATTGATGLFGRSRQEFTSVDPLEYDQSQFVVINLRLLAVESTPRPLFRRSNPIPPPRD